MGVNFRIDRDSLGNKVSPKQTPVRTDPARRAARRDPDGAIAEAPARRHGSPQDGAPQATHARHGGHGSDRSRRESKRPAHQIRRRAEAHRGGRHGVPHLAVVLLRPCPFRDHRRRRHRRLRRRQGCRRTPKVPKPVDVALIHDEPVAKPEAVALATPPSGERSKDDLTFAAAPAADVSLVAPLAKACRTADGRCYRLRAPERAEEAGTHQAGRQAGRCQQASVGQ